MTKNGSQVVVVTGASGGVGRAVVQRFAKRSGMNLALIARGAKGLEGARREAEHAGARAMVIQADVSDAQAVNGAVEQIEHELGPIDIWINVAMTTVFGTFMKITPEDYKRVTEVTYLGYVYCTQSALKRMIPRHHGTIVQVGSSVAYRGIPLQTAYSGAKHAIQGFTEALREELTQEKAGIKLTMVQLPGLNTPQFTWCKNTMDNRWQPIPPIYDPDIAARAIEWAAYHPKREYYVGKATYKAIWADKLIPGFVDKYLALTGYKSQLQEEHNDPRKPNNLYKPVDIDFGARGSFSAQSKKGSPLVWLMTHPTLRRLLIILGIGIDISICMVVKRYAKSCPLLQTRKKRALFR